MADSEGTIQSQIAINPFKRDLPMVVVLTKNKPSRAPANQYVIDHSKRNERNIGFFEKVHKKISYSFVIIKINLVQMFGVLQNVEYNRNVQCAKKTIYKERCREMGFRQRNSTV